MKPLSRTLMTLIVSSAFAVTACKSDDIVNKYTKVVDEMCKCADSACADKVMNKRTELMQSFTKPSKAGVETLEKLDVKWNKCRAAFAKPVTKSAPPKVVKIPERGPTTATPVSRCDQRKNKGYCVDAFKAAWSMGEKQVKSNCNMGEFAKQPCPIAKLLGHCDVGHAYRVSYYAGTAKQFTAATAKAACKDEFASDFRAPK